MVLVPLDYFEREERMKQFSPQKLLRWYAKHKRDLPWRRTKDPYRIWVSEVMLQQTQALRVVDFYSAFVEKFPTVQRLARALWPQVLSAVRGMGYYGRFRNMRKTAKIVVKDFGEKFPADYGALRKLPGVGDYTANAILAFAFGKDAAAVDTNVRRVLQHFYGKKNLEALKKLAMKLCPKNRARDFFQAIMDYAPLIKRASPLRIQSKRKPLAKTSGVRVAAGIIHQKGKILIQQRKNTQHLAGFWEFPGGKIEPNEDARHCLKREIREELGIEVAVRPAFLKLQHAYPDRRVHLSFHRCSVLLGKAKSREGQKFVWVSPHELPQYRLAPADQPAVERLTKQRALQ